MIEKDLDILFKSNSGIWDKQIAFSPKDIAAMFNIPLSTIIKKIKEGAIECFKVGRYYRVSRLSLYKFIKNNECLYDL